jgi:SPP1 family predicted phage head-tail adaptor
MNPGKLDRRIVIQALTTVTDALGSITETWADLATVWAEYVPLSGLEQIEAGKLTSRSIAKFRIRYRAGLTTKHRIVADGSTYNIRHLEDHRRKGEHVMMCEEVE